MWNFSSNLRREETVANAIKLGIRLGECGEKRWRREEEVQSLLARVAVDYGCYGGLSDKIFRGKPRDCIVGAT